MFRRVAPTLIQATKPVFARNLASGWEYTASPTDINTAATVEQPTDLLLTLTRQDEFLMAAETVVSVTIPTENGVMGVLPGHEYVIEKVLPGVIDVKRKGSDGKEEDVQYATAGGFAHVNTDGSVDLQLAECVPIASMDLANCEKELAAAQELVRAGDDAGKVRGAIGVATMEPIITALKA